MSENTYTIKRAPDTPDVARIACYPWDSGYRPRAEARLSLCDDGLLLEMTAWEKTIIAEETRTGGDVYRDSCMEFFFQPRPDSDPRYINFEANAAGVMHIGVGAGRGGREVLRQLPDDLRVLASVKRGERWSVQYTITPELIGRWFEGFSFKSGMRMRGNFYKCDESIHPHFGCWNPINALTPDFHRPDCFGWIVLD